jgi:hypothetical protein
MQAVQEDKAMRYPDVVDLHDLQAPGEKQLEPSKS